MPAARVFIYNLCPQRVYFFIYTQYSFHVVYFLARSNGFMHWHISLVRNPPTGPFTTYVRTLCSVLYVCDHNTCMQVVCDFLIYCGMYLSLLLNMCSVPNIVLVHFQGWLWVLVKDGTKRRPPVCLCDSASALLRLTHGSSSMGLNVGLSFSFCLVCVSPLYLLNSIVAAWALSRGAHLSVCSVASNYCRIGVPHLCCNNCRLNLHILLNEVFSSLQVSWRVLGSSRHIQC